MEQINDQSPAGFYTKQVEAQQQILSRLLKRKSALGWIRLAVFVITIFISYQVFVSAGLYGLIPLCTGLAALLFLVSLDVNNNLAIRNAQTLIRINQEELKFLDHQFQQHDDGSTYTPAHHDYANDLDLFGPSSLFQWMNRGYSEGSRSLLAKNLLHPLAEAGILERQEAIKELKNQVEWRQQLQSYSEQTPITIATEERTAAWLDEDEKYFTGIYWKIIVMVYPVITLGAALATMLGYISAGVFSFLYGLFLTTSIILSRNTIKPYLQLSGIVKEIATLQNLVAWIESKSFKAKLLKKIQADAKQNNEAASWQIKKLRAILDRFDLRLNIAGLLFFNAFLLWDVRQMMALNAWRKKNRQIVPHWFLLIYEMEVLHGLATIHFNHPGFAFPSLTKEHFNFSSEELGHPLIPATARVCSSFTLSGTSKIGLITGSNMAGKSTFLRSLGINIVLAQLGAPVCASSLSFSPVHLMSSMRIADNLAENTSTFYAELKKLKTIIEAVNRHEKVFILLDEILRGTNSLDRHTGSAALIKQLIRQEAVAVIATHDVELAALENQYPRSIENYHFDVQVAGEELFFDYKLKPGVCTSLNASILMKKIGIDLNS